MGFCSKGSGGGKGAMRIAALGAATAIAGPAGAAVVLPFLGSNPTPAQQQNYDAAVAYNQQVATSNAARQKFIDEYVEKAVGGTSETEKRMGQAFATIAEDAKREFGDEIMGMTLMQFRAAHPEKLAAYFDKFKQMVPEAAPYTVDQILSETPDSLKNVPMSKLLEAYPSGGIISTITNAVSSPIGIGAAVLLVAVILIFSRKKKPSSTVVG